MLDTNFDLNDNGEIQNALAVKLRDAIQGKDNAVDAQNAIATTLQSYLIENLEVVGTYANALLPTAPSPTPDPLMGSYNFKLASCLILGVLLLAGASGGFPGWLLAINTAVKLGIGKPTDESGLITGVPFTNVGVNIIIDVSGSNDFNNSMNQIAKGVIESILNSAPVGGGVATSTAGGTGTLTYNNYQ